MSDDPSSSQLWGRCYDLSESGALCDLAKGLPAWMFMGFISWLGPFEWLLLELFTLLQW